MPLSEKEELAHAVAKNEADTLFDALSDMFYDTMHEHMSP